MRILMSALFVLSASCVASPNERLGAATKRHPDAPPEVAELEFFLGKWKTYATFRSADGTERHTEAELEGTYILSGYGIQVVEVHTPDLTVFPEVDSTFVVTTIYNYDTDNGKWSGASVNSLGNRKFVDGELKNGELVLIQDGKLFRGRQGQNRLTFFNISDDTFEMRLDSHDEKEGEWRVGTYGYVAKRISP